MKINKTGILLAAMLAAVTSVAAIGFSNRDIIRDYDLDATAETFIATGNIGTGSENGVIGVGNYRIVTFEVNVSQLAVTGAIKSRILCRVSGASAWVQEYPVLAAGTVTPSYVSLSAVGGYTYTMADKGYSHCKTGALIDSADDGGDLTTNAEKLSVSIGYVTR